MATSQTYCTVADVKDILSDNGVLVRTDDDESGAVAGSGTESTVQANAVDRAASKMNMYLEQTAYTLVSLANNAWCKWCNATIAAVEFCKRRGNPVPQPLLEDFQWYMDMLMQLARGVFHAIPGTNPAVETSPTVSNLTTEPYKHMPVRRRPFTSTGKPPDGHHLSWPEEPRRDYSI